MASYLVKNAYFLALVFLVLIGFQGIQAQEITDEIKDEQLQVLQEDPRDFNAHFIVGAWHYNQAIAPHKKTLKMDLSEYLSNGAALEAEKAVHLKAALPYFENAFAIDRNKAQVKDVLKVIYKQLGKLPVARATDTEVDQKFDGLLGKIEFQDLRQ